MKKQYLKNETILDGRYRILAFKQESGDGFLYDAVSILTQRQVRIKELFPSVYVSRQDDGESLYEISGTSGFEILKKRFLKEARLLKDFRDLPGIVRILDYFEANGTAYCVMEKTKGVSLIAETLLTSNSFFQKYGGSATWEYRKA